MTRRHATITATLDPMTDDEARRAFERWAKVTGRQIDWATVTVIQDPEHRVTKVVARSR